MKKANIFSLIILLFNIFLSPSIVVADVINTAQTSGTSINFIKNVSITDGDGNDLSDNTISDSTKVRFNFGFEVPNSYTLVPGEKYIINIDNKIKYRTGSNPIELWFDGVSMGTVDIVEGQAIITFNDSVKTLTNIKGEFNFWSNFDKFKIDYDNGNDILLPTSDNPENKIHLNFTKDDSGESSGDSVISKRLNSYDKTDPTLINWAITVNNVGNAVDNSIFVDRMEPGMEYVAGSTSIKYRNYKGTDGILRVDNSDLNFIKQSDGSTQVTINFGELTSEASKDPDAITSISISYQARIIDNGLLGKYPNHALSFDGNKELGKVNSTASWRGQDGGGSGDNNSRDLKVKKIWNDNDNVNQLRPDHVVIHLLRNGEQFITRSALASDNWNYEFTNLAIMDPDGKPYKYEIKEESVPNYTSKIIETDAGFNIENSLSDNIKTSVTGTKSWEDDNNSDYMRPSSIKINLLQNGIKIDSKKVSADNNWKYAFNDLAYNDKNGQKYEYTVSEDKVPNYVSKIDGYDVINTLNPDINISGSKTWVDDDNLKKTRPEKITINLLANGKQIDSKKVTAGDDWKYKFSNLAKNDSTGKEIVYTISEDSVAGYASEINGYNVKNTLLKGVTPTLPQKISIAGSKTWVDDDNLKKTRPANITINLLANGKQIDSKKVTAGDDWKYKFSNLAKNDSTGKEIVYTISEDSVAGYVSEINGYNVKNTLLKGVTPTLPQIPSTNTPEVNPITPDVNNNGNDVDQPNVPGQEGNIVDNVETTLPKTATQKLTVVGLLSVFLVVLVGMIILNKKRK